MLLRCIKDFGSFKVGDEVEVRDDVQAFDHQNFEIVAQPDEREGN